MTSYNIVVFGGDHCGPEVVAEAVKVCFFLFYSVIQQGIYILSLLFDKNKRRMNTNF